MSYQNNDRFETTNWDAQRVRRAQEEQQRQLRQKRKKARRRSSLLAYIGFILVVSAILAGTAWLLANDICSFNKEDVETTIIVTEEDTIGTVAKKLKEEGLINYRGVFRLFAAVFNADEKIGPGAYVLNSDMDYRALINGMIPRQRPANAETVRVRIPEGATVQEIIALLAENGVSTEEALTEAAKTGKFGYQFTDDVETGDVSRLEGYLFPDTYEFYVGEDPTSALKRLVDNFYSKVSSYLDQIEASKYSLRQIITIASLIEKETDGSDREKISSVIYNRLENAGETHYLLQIDAALVYAAGRPITQADYTSLDSPYNLYQHQGLPPTPIANPGLASIEAAVEPASTDYYFYVLGKDGKHIFSKTLAEHNKAVASVS
ncbi:MAG: endolytic transglycosylase MltG [Oscillospiraceae bacterium]